MIQSRKSDHFKCVSFQGRLCHFRSFKHRERDRFWKLRYMAQHISRRFRSLSEAILAQLQFSVLGKCKKRSQLQNQLVVSAAYIYGTECLVRSFGLGVCPRIEVLSIRGTGTGRLGVFVAESLLRANSKRSYFVFNARRDFSPWRQQAMRHPKIQLLIHLSSFPKPIRSIGPGIFL